MLKILKVIAFTYQNCSLEEVGALVIEKEERPQRLKALKEYFQFDELFYITTCNRVELVFSTGADTSQDSCVRDIIAVLYPDLSPEQLTLYTMQAAVYDDYAALNHLMRVSCSIESLVLGEREILAQVRQMYEECREWGLTGDFFRMLMSCLVKTSKEVYTHTGIAERPVSVASVACRMLRSEAVELDARFLLIGAGETMQLFAKYLKEHQMSKCVVFNRTLAKAQELAEGLGAEAFPISELKNYKQGFDVIITCTGATEPIITKDIYESLLAGEHSKKVIVDLAIPNDTAPEVVEYFKPVFISLQQIQRKVEESVNERKTKLVEAEAVIADNISQFIPLLKKRRVDLAMQEVPVKIKEIRNKATEIVFAKDIEKLDDNAREVLNQVLNYVEKKYISVPMVMAHKVMLNE